MTIRITDWLVTSDKTWQCAAALDPANPDAWTVSWLPPEQTVDRSQVVSAMVLAEWVSRGVRRGHRRWPYVELFAADLGLTAERAVELVTTADLLVLNTNDDREGADQ